jgi:conjugal transfer/entry exclusion protein
MSCDLEVDTDRLRAAAALLHRVADVARTVSCPRTVPDHAAGGSAAAREALRLAVTRSKQAYQANGMLAESAARLADLLAEVARQFDAAEALCRTGR